MSAKGATVAEVDTKRSPTHKVLRGSDWTWCWCASEFEHQIDHEMPSGLKENE